jgi:PAS domain S-box-containing protein
MLTELLHDRAALYVAGAMTAPERENFELILLFHAEVRAQVARLQRAMAAVSLSRLARLDRPSDALKGRVLATLMGPAGRLEPEAVVVTSPEGLVEWVNPAFTAMCGYSISELKGRKPGHLLQGPATDAVSVDRIRTALRERRACRETLINYHKDGGPYSADVRIDPVLDDEREPLWFVARERKLPLAGPGG